MAADPNYTRALRRCYFRAMADGQSFLLTDPEHKSMITLIRRNNTNLFMSGVVGLPLIYIFHTRGLKHMQNRVFKWMLTSTLSLGLLVSCVRLLRSKEASDQLTALAWKVEKQLLPLCPELQPPKS